MVGAIHVVVPTCRPTPDLVLRIERLAENFSLTVADDASPCTYDDFFYSFRFLSNISIIRFPQREGIARSLNAGLEQAVQCSASWLLTIDQDSEVTTEYVDEIQKFASGVEQSHADVAAVGASRIVGPGGSIGYPIQHAKGMDFTEEIIQSGSAWRVSALREVGGFDETLGMDAVDAAACLRLRQRGFRLALVPDLQLRHQIGNAKTVGIMGRSVMITGHSPERRASMLSNRLRLFPSEFRQSPKHAIRTIRRVVTNQVVGLLIESDRVGKLRGSVKGITRAVRDLR